MREFGAGVPAIVLRPVRTREKGGEGGGGEDKEDKDEEKEEGEGEGERIEGGM